MTKLTALPTRNSQQAIASCTSHPSKLQLSTQKENVAQAIRPEAQRGHGHEASVHRRLGRVESARVVYVRSWKSWLVHVLPRDSAWRPYVLHRPGTDACWLPVRGW